MGPQSRIILRLELAFQVVLRRSPIGLKKRMHWRVIYATGSTEDLVPHKHPLVNVYTITNRLTVEAGMPA